MKPQFSSVPYAEFMHSDKWLVNYFLLQKKTQRQSAAAAHTVKLHTLVEERNEALDPQKYPAWRFIYLGLEHIESNTGFLNEVEIKLGKEVKSRSKVFYGGDLLYGKLRPTLNKVYKVDDDFSGGGLCSTEFFVLKVKEDKVPSGVLRFLLASAFVLEQIRTFTAGAALPRISAAEFMKIDIPLPDKGSMAKFSEEIVQLNREIARAREVYFSAPRLYRELFASVYGEGEKGNSPLIADGGRKNELEGSLPPEYVKMKRGSGTHFY